MARRGERHPDQTVATIAARWAVGVSRHWWRDLLGLLMLEAAYEMIVVAAGGLVILGVLPGIGVAVGLWWQTFRWAKPIVEVSRDA